MKKNSPKAQKKRTSKLKEWRVIRGGVTAPQGYLAAGVAAGIKKKGLDVAVLFSGRPASAAALFTTNQVQAAPVLLSKKHLKLANGRIRAVLVNSGCANACTGEKGMQDAMISARSLASLLGIDASQIIVASTGVIGELLPLRSFLKGISTAVASLNSSGGNAAMRAIMTTDTREKTIALEGELGNRKIRIGGMAKGAGMIHPQLATMLAVITTDVSLPPKPLDRMVRRVADRTFNCLTVDGDTSTNDMVLAMANGASDCRLEAKALPYFEEGLERVCEELAKMIARDGEGATKFVEIEVHGAESYSDAKRVAKAIAHSPLVKTALHGEEPNWGRIICAAGYSGVSFDLAKIELLLCGIPIFKYGAPTLASVARAAKALKSTDIQIELHLGKGHHSARVWTCDLSRKYVEINASYIS
jgi:glutamate N-acetyltransferase/amino-acid N-acetyltransferase